MRRTNPLRLAAAFALLAGLIVGCAGSSTAPTTQPTTKHDHDDHDDDDHHDKAGMMMSHVGKNHAYLTAHLSQKDGHELDLFFETSGTDAKPLAIAMTKITGTARRAGEDKEMEIVFEPAPAAERPKDEKPGTCSHFVVKAPWLKPDDVLTVTADVEVDGRKRKATWKRFIPKEFAHHKD